MGRCVNIIGEFVGVWVKLAYIRFISNEDGDGDEAFRFVILCKDSIIALPTPNVNICPRFLRSAVMSM